MKGRDATNTTESRRDNKAPRHSAPVGKKHHENQQHVMGEAHKTERAVNFKSSHLKLKHNKSKKRFDGNQQSRVHGSSDKENLRNVDGDSKSSSNNGNSNFSGNDVNIKNNNLGYYSDNNNNNNSSRYNNSRGHYKINRLNGTYEDQGQNRIHAPVVISDSSNSDFTFDVTVDDVNLSKKTFVESYSQFLSIKKEPNIDAYLHYNYMLTGHIFRQHSMQVLANLQNGMNLSKDVDKAATVSGSSHGAHDANSSNS